MFLFVFEFFTVYYQVFDEESHRLSNAADPRIDIVELMLLEWIQCGTKLIVRPNFGRSG